jgi:hypothetical protein
VTQFCGCFRVFLFGSLTEACNLPPWDLSVVTNT